ncbi:Tubulin-folding cofactor B [Hondaea fermentalgiana]|uniref:Tubulin-folding cofactor B n=1 Tax=Hondaea fermentalgiana TaxID=2315210 RepID=A0A2R5GFJ6_9STRA|nr:Tubulin-folding cofactor B [Hondaea fermentalgiana]|eukprot:GBG29696.1 Tubulin-folding cofactor B [Hondaea fermentalgiana]
MAALDMNTLNQYVRLEDGQFGQQVAEGTALVDISHSNLQQRWPEIRVDLHTTVGALKDRLYRHGGTGAGFQRLVLKQDGTTLCELDDDTKMLGFYGVATGMNIHIIDTDPYSFSKDGGLENVDLVEKYVMSDEDYNKRENSIRAYKKKMREKDPYFTLLPENRREPKNKNPPTEKDVEGFTVGDRCQIQPGSRRGVVAWKGDGENLVGNGYWIGVRLDEPLGKGNGTVKGKRFFEADEKHAAFVRPDKCEVGDFPELDPLAELSSDDEDEI